MKILTVLALFGGILLGVLPIQAQTTPHTCNSPIYCPGPLLQKVQLAQLYPDSKTFVDKVDRKSLYRSYPELIPPKIHATKISSFPPIVADIQAPGGCPERFRRPT